MVELVGAWLAAYVALQLLLFDACFPPLDSDTNRSREGASQDHERARRRGDGRRQKKQPRQKQKRGAAKHLVIG